MTDLEQTDELPALSEVPASVVVALHGADSAAWPGTYAGPFPRGERMPAVGIRGCMYDHAQAYAKPGVALDWPKGPMHVLAGIRPTTPVTAMDMAEAPDQTTHAVRTDTGYKPVSALFAAAIGVLREEPDQLAALCKLADAFPKATLAEVCQTLREVAVMLHVAAVGREERV